MQEEEEEEEDDDDDEKESRNDSHNDEDDEHLEACFVYFITPANFKTSELAPRVFTHLC